MLTKKQHKTDKEMIIQGLNEASQKIHEANKEKGFYDKPREIGTLLMLVVSELSEALEADRKSIHANFSAYQEKLESEPDRAELKQPYLFQEFIKDSFEDEIADAMIRLFDLCGYLNIDIENHIKLKLQYNKNRTHKHGKNY